MAISVECESCGAGFKVADNLVGKRGKCPKCGAVFTAVPVDHADAPSEAKTNSPKSPAKKQPGTARRHSDSGSSSNVRPAASVKRSAGPPPAPARAVPVGSVPGGIPVGGLPGDSSVGVAIVRPAMGAGVSGGKSSSGRAKPYRRKKGTPAIVWVIIIVGGLSATGGWIYVATREPPKPVAQTSTPKNTNAPEKQASDKKTPTETKAATGSDAPEKKQADTDEKGNSDDRKLSIVPEAEVAKEDAGGLDSALAGGGDLGSKTKKRPAVKITTHDPATKSPAEKETEAAPPESTPVTAEELTALAEACKQNGWKADSKEQYAQLAALASGMMNFADDAAGEVAIALLHGPLREVVWTSERVSRINRNAAREIDKVGSGCFVVAQVTEQVEGGALLKLVSTETMIKIELSGAQLAQARPGVNFLLIGTIEPETYDLPASKSGEARHARVINHLYRMIISEIYDRETSTIGPAGGGE